MADLEGGSDQPAPQIAEENPEHTALLLGIRPQLSAVLEHMSGAVEGFESALLCTATGTVVAHRDLPDDEVVDLGLWTAAAYEASRTGPDPVETIAVKLRTGVTVMVAAVGTQDVPVLLRLTSDKAGLGVVLHVVRTAATQISDLISD